MTSPTVPAHVARARQKFYAAVSYQRNFGSPMAEFSESHNRLRMEACKSHVTMLAFEAGQFLAYGGHRHLGAAFDELAGFSGTSQEIRDAVRSGYHDVVSTSV